MCDAGVCSPPAANSLRWVARSLSTCTTGLCTVRGVEIVEPARVEERAEIPYVGIRVVAPFRGMLAERDRLLTEVRAWVEEGGVGTVGYGFFRLHVIDMAGAMDFEAGYFTPGPVKMKHPRIRPGSMAAGRYATMKYQDHARRANQALQDWVRDNDLVLDRRTVPEGDAFACRYEAYLDRPGDRAAEDHDGRLSCRCC